MSTVYIQNVDAGISLNAADMDGVWWLDISSTDVEVEVEKVESDVSETTFRSEDVCSVCHSLGSVSLRDCMAGRSMS